MDLSLATPELKPRCFEIQSLTSSSTEVRDEGYSPSPNTKIDKDEGYSPSPGSISIFCDQNSLSSFSPSSDPRVSALVSAFFFAGLPLPTTLPFLPSSARLCVARIPSPWSGLEALQMGSLPHPLINSWGGPSHLPALTVIHSWVRGLFDLSN
jgi:hypothetical protein